MNDWETTPTWEWAARRVGLRRTPLRRRVDRLENATRLAVLVLALAVLPLAVAIGKTVYQHGLAVSAAQTATRHQISAVLIASPIIVDNSGATTQVLATTHWTAPDGTTHTGSVSTYPGTAAGTRVPVWVDAAGKVTDQPLSPDQAYWQGWLATLSAVTADIAMMAALLGIVRWRLDRTRYAAWDAEWARIGPQWTGYRS